MAARPIDLSGRKILVVGASSGIGEATAQAIAAGGGIVIACARRKDVLGNVVASLPGSGHLALAVDATDADAVAQTIADLPVSARPVNGAVFCAGVHSLRPARITQAAHYSEMFQKNVLSITNFLPPLSRIWSDGASLVLVSSAARFRGGAAAGAYVATKGALADLARAWANELAPRIRVNSVSPGVVRTGMTEKFLGTVGLKATEQIEKRHLLGLGEPTQVASAIAFLLSDHATWITGTDLTVDGGFAIQA